VLFSRKVDSLEDSREPVLKCFSLFSDLEFLLLPIVELLMVFVLLLLLHVVTLLVAVVVIIHWNACFYLALSAHIGQQTADAWVYSQYAVSN